MIIRAVADHREQHVVALKLLRQRDEIRNIFQARHAGHGDNQRFAFRAQRALQFRLRGGILIRRAARR